MTDQDAGIAYVIDIDLGKNGGLLKAKATDEVERWLSHEREFWGWLLAGRKSHEMQQIATHATNHLGQLRDFLEKWKSGTDSDQNRTRLQNSLAQFYGHWKLLHSSTAEAKLVEQLREESGEDAALAALATCLKQPVTLQRNQPVLRPEIFQGAARMIMLQAAVDAKTPRLVRNKLDDTLAEYRERMEGSTSRSQELEGKLECLVDQHQSIKDRAVSSIATAVKLAREKARRQVEEAEERLVQLERLYNEKLSLDAPVQYWSTKRRKHRGLSITFMSVFVVLVVFAAVAVQEIIMRTRLGDLQFWQSADLAAFALVALVVGVTVAVIRVPLRLAMSELHLGNDADERVTMVNTYLALRAGEHASTEHMQIVLDRLFKPAADGIVKDDLGPVTPADVAMRLFQR